MPAQPGAAPTPTTPGPPPTPIQRATVARIAVGAPINLPPGYTLPPGWAVIPAHNVQIIPPATQTVVGTASPTIQTVVMQGLPAGNGAPQHGALPPPGSATSPTAAAGDVTISNNDHLAPNSGQSASAAPPRSATNINSPPSATPTNSQNLDLPNLMQQRTAGHRMSAPQSPHPAFPITIPLVPSGGSVGDAAYQRSSVATRTNSATETLSQESPRVNGTTNPSTDAGERFAILSQMTDSIRTMQDLLVRMQSLNQPPLPATTTTIVSSHPTTSPLTPPSPPSTSNVLQPPSPNSHNCETTSTSLTSPPGHNRMHKRRSMSPVGRHGESDALTHPADRLHCLSSSDEELTPEELADIKAPWVEQPLDDELPLPEVRTSRKDSPQRVRANSQSPIRQLRRRSSLLRHEITEEILDDERDPEKNRTLAGLDLEPTVVGSSNDRASLDKGKGKAISVEDDA